MLSSTRPARWIFAVLCIGVMALVVAGCGSSDSSDSSDASVGTTAGASSGEKLSKADFVSNYCAIRASSGNEIEKLQSPKDPTDLDQVAKSLSDYAAVTSSQVDQLRQLNPPDSMQADWDTVIGNLEENQGTLEGIIEKAKQGDKSAIDDLRTEQPNGKETSKLITKLGLSTCDSPSS